MDGFVREGTCSTSTFLRLRSVAVLLAVASFGISAQLGACSPVGAMGQEDAGVPDGSSVELGDGGAPDGACVPACPGKTCGQLDGCGGVCQIGSGCCSDDCNGKVCGDKDGCGKTCMWGSGCTDPHPESLPLVRPNDLLYVGSFRLPSGTHGGENFGFARMGLGYNQPGKSLIITGKRYPAEVSIPAAIAADRPEDLNVATFIQPFTDVTEGSLWKIECTQPGCPTNGQPIGDYYVYNNRLIFNAYTYYSSTQLASHFVSSLDFSTTGDVQGPFALGDGTWHPRMMGNYMTGIPVAWRLAFEAPAVTGGCCLSMIATSSMGPALFAFDPQELIDGVAKPRATPLLAYPATHATLGTYDDTTFAPDGTLYNMGSGNQNAGLVFPEGTRSLLFFVHQGIGRPCYGTGVGCPSDPESQGTGPHAYPAVDMIFAYDALDLLDVKTGKKQPWDLRPYSVWQIPKGGANGVAYDQANGRIYLSQPGVDTTHSVYQPQPIIHVYQVQLGAPGPDFDFIWPTVDLGSPAHETTVSGTVLFSATASDNRGVAEVQFHLDGKPFGAKLTSPPYELQVDTTTLRNGRHYVISTARDLQRNLAASQRSARIWVNNPTPQDPVIAQFAASPTAITSGASTTLSWSISNADDFSLDNGYSGESTSGSMIGSKTVSPAKTTTYAIHANKGTRASFARVTVTVN